MATQAPIVVIDDNPDFQAFIGRVLARRNLACVHVFTGRDGLHFVKAHKPKVVVLDINLPDISGYEVLRLIRQEVPGVSVIVATVDPTPEVSKRIRDRGAEWVVQKPVDPDDLLRKVAVLLALRSSPPRL